MSKEFFGSAQVPLSPAVRAIEMIFRISTLHMPSISRQTLQHVRQLSRA